MSLYILIAMINVEKIVREYIQKTVHMSLATVKDNKPWVCEVHFAYDEGLNLYFVSKQSTRHCQEIALNPAVAGNIVKTHQLSELPHGIYFEGNAELLEFASDQEVRQYCERLERDPIEVAEQLKESGGKRMYKILVSNWAIFGKFDQASLQKYELKWESRGNEA